MLNSRNIALVAGIGLPTLVAILFTLAQVLPARLVAPPQYDFLYSVESYATLPDVNLRFWNDKGKLRATYQKINPSKNKYVGARMFRNRLFRFDAKSLSSREIFLEIPGPLSDDMTDEKWHELSIPETEAIALDDRSLFAPDGYRFRDGDTDRLGVVTRLLFYHGQFNQLPSIVKGQRAIAISFEVAGSRGYEVHFLGWMIARGDAP